MATPFTDIETAARKDVSMDGSSKVSSDDIFRFIRDGYHEAMHGLTQIKAQYNATTGAISYLPETLDSTVDMIPDGMDGYVSHLTHYVKWRILTCSRMDTAQIARAKMELDAFQDIFRVSDVARR